MQVLKYDVFICYLSLLMLILMVYVYTTVTTLYSE